MKNSPRAPDPYETARAQGAVNRETAITQAGLNMTNQYTPGGSLEYNQTGTWADGTPRYESRQTLSPEQQGLYDMSTQAGQQYGQTALNQLSSVSGRLSQPFSTDRAGFDERSYLAANPDVAANGGNAYDHYNQYGRAEGRSGSGAMERSLNTSGLPGLSSSAGAIGNAGPLYGIANAGNIQNGIANAGNIQNGIANAGGIQSGFEDVGNALGSIKNVGSAQRDLGDFGQTARGFADVGGQQRTIDYSAFGDPNIARSSVENALMQRMAPQLSQDRAALETKLANQGLSAGTQAYDQGIDEFNRQVNDARLGAIINAGGEQSRIAGLGIAQGQFANQGQERDYAQALGRASFFNSGQAQDFGQGATRAGLYNQGQAQDFGQQISAADLANRAQAQNFGQAQDRAAFSNQAQQQQYGQNAQDAAFANSAQQQQYGQNANDASFWNQAQQADFGQSLSNANLGNQARAQGFNESLNSANFANQARQNAIGENVMNRQQPLNELAALMSGIQMQGPSFMNTPQTGVQGTDVTGPTMQNYQMQMQQRNAAMGGLFGLGSAALAGGRFW